MPLPLPAVLLCAINAGSPTAGAITTVTGSTALLSMQSTVGVTAQLFEIFDYPIGFALPAGWSLNASTGVYFYSTSVSPPSFSPSVWGKYMLRLTLNNGTNNAGQADPTLATVATALTIYSPVGLADQGFEETTQFNAFKLWVGDLRANWRTIDTALAGAVVGLSNATPATIATVGNAGVAITASRGDHVHSLTFTPVQTVLAAASGPIAVNAQNITSVGASLAFATTAAGPALSQTIRVGTGVNDGQPLLVVAQPGQAQTGGASNNDGGDLVLRAGLAGTGGGGAAGVQGTAWFQGGGHTATLSTSGLAVNAPIDVGTHKVTSVSTPTASTDAANKGYADMAVSFLAQQVDIVTPVTGAPLNGGGPAVYFKGFRANVALTIGTITLTAIDAAWVADAVHYWRLIVFKNGTGAGTSDALATLSIAQTGTITMIASSTFSCAAGDVFAFSFSPQSGPADLARCELNIDIVPA